MFFKGNTINISLLSAILILLASGVISAQDKIINLQFAPAPVSDSATTIARPDIVKARGIDRDYSTGGLYLLSNFGDNDELFQKENQKAIDDPFINHSWRYCSVFRATANDSVLLGRNWDNQNVGSILVSLYRPPQGYASISFSRAIDLGFGENLDLAEFVTTPLGTPLLLAPFYAMDGINNQGLIATVTGVRQTTHKNNGDKRPIFVTFLIRKILDQTKTVDEAIALAQKYVPFDLDSTSLNSHILVADATGKSAVLEYEQDQWRVFYGGTSRQIMTNKPIYNVPEADLRDQCWRYKSISESLDNAGGVIDWRAGLKILRDVSQMGTTWSVIYTVPAKELYFSVFQKWGEIYHIKLP